MTEIIEESINNEAFFMTYLGLGLGAVTLGYKPLPPLFATATISFLTGCHLTTAGALVATGLCLLSLKDKLSPHIKHANQAAEDASYSNSHSAQLNQRTELENGEEKSFSLFD